MKQQKRSERNNDKWEMTQKSKNKQKQKTIINIELNVQKII